MLRSILFISLLLPLGSASAALQRYVASEHESAWVSSSSKLYCSLSHEIPVFGQAKFERIAAGQLGMKLMVKRAPHKPGVARLTSVAPSWKHDVRERDLGQVSYTVSNTPITLQHIAARRLLLELERGMFPTFAYQDWADGRDEVAVSLSAVNIRAALGEFLDCLAAQGAFGIGSLGSASAGLGAVISGGIQRSGGQPYSSTMGASAAGYLHDFLTHNETKVYFAFDSSRLRSEAKEQLNEIATYILADESITGVTMCGHTDSRGSRRYNDLLGRRRAAAVKDYLKRLGVNEGSYTLQVKACGEKNPFASNRSSEGRALNRAVKLTLMK